MRTAAPARTRSSRSGLPSRSSKTALSTSARTTTSATSSAASTTGTTSSSSTTRYSPTSSAPTPLCHSETQTGSGSARSSRASRPRRRRQYRNWDSSRSRYRGALRLSWAWRFAIRWARAPSSSPSGRADWESSRPDCGTCTRRYKTGYWRAGTGRSECGRTTPRWASAWRTASS